MNYTPGEWKIIEANNGTFIIRNDRNLQICEYVKVTDDAQLIAAAPDMYEAIKALQTYITKTRQLNRTDTPERLWDAMCVIVDKLNKALAKAEGKEEQ